MNSLYQNQQIFSNETIENIRNSFAAEVIIAAESRSHDDIPKPPAISIWTLVSRILYQFPCRGLCLPGMRGYKSEFVF